MVSLCDQLAKIDPVYRSQYTDIIGRARILNNGNPYYNSSRNEIIDMIKAARSRPDGGNVDIATELMIENNSTGSPFIISRIEWQ